MMKKNGQKLVGNKKSVSDAYGDMERAPESNNYGDDIVVRPSNQVTYVFPGEARNTEYLDAPEVYTNPTVFRLG